MSQINDRKLNLIAAIGLSIGAVFGLAGTMVIDPNLQSILWAIDSVGLVVATSLLTLKFFRQEKDFVAAGFLIFAIGEGVLLSGTAAGPTGSVPSFAAGTALWAAALAMTTLPKQFAIWIRIIGIIASILFAFTSIRIFSGEQILPTASPLPFFAYPFLVFTFLGWIWTLLRENSATK
jgi:hypothetical protein